MIEQKVKSHQYFAAGFISYDAAPGFDPNLKTKDPGRFPLMLFGLYESAVEVAPPLFTQTVAETVAETVAATESPGVGSSWFFPSTGNSMPCRSIESEVLSRQVILTR